ncbi:hypothetical protein [Mycobacterium nebraskense]
MIASKVESTPPSSPDFSVNAVPPVVPGMSPGRTFRQALMATVTGCGGRPPPRRPRPAPAP